MPEVELEIKGMTYDSCARHVKATLEQAGATEASVDWRAPEVRAWRGSWTSGRSTTR
jgi:hypothetical protein